MPWLVVTGLFGSAALLDRFAAVERSTGRAGVDLATAALIAAGAYYLYKQAS